MRRPVGILSIMIISFLFLSVNGCTFIFQKGRPVGSEKIESLKKDVNALEREKTALVRAKTDLERAKDDLENRLRREINDRQVSVENLERGLVITFVADVLFNSGKAELREESLDTLTQVARVLNTTVSDLNVGIEGHTDNDPIKHSGWKSNWELSTARATSVLHFLVDQTGVDPRRLSAIGYGEYHPVADNMTIEGKQKNRRVEIVILPRIEKVKGE